MTKETQFLTPAEVAEIFRTKTLILAQWRHHGTGPKFVKLGKNVLYRKSDVEDYINSLESRQSTSEGQP